MKRILFLLLLIAITASSFAQQKTTFKTGSYIGYSKKKPVMKIYFTKTNTFFAEYYYTDLKDYRVYGSWKFKGNKMSLVFGTYDNKFSFSGESDTSLNNKRELAVSIKYDATSSFINFYCLLLKDTSDLHITGNAGKLYQKGKLIDSIGEKNNYVAVYDMYADSALLVKLPEKYNKYKLNFNPYAKSDSTPFSLILRHGKLFEEKKDEYDTFKLEYDRPLTDDEEQVVIQKMKSSSEAKRHELNEGFIRMKVPIFPDDELSDRIVLPDELSDSTVFSKSWADVLALAKEKQKNIIAVYAHDKELGEWWKKNYFNEASFYRIKDGDTLLHYFKITTPTACVIADSNGNMLSKTEGILPNSLYSFIDETKQAIREKSIQQNIAEFEKGNRSKEVLLTLLDLLGDINSTDPMPVDRKTIADMLSKTYLSPGKVDSAVYNKLLNKDIAWGNEKIVNNLMATYTEVAAMYANDKSKTGDSLRVDFFQRALPVFNGNFRQYANGDIIHCLDWLKSLDGIEYYIAMNEFIKTTYTELNYEDCYFNIGIATLRDTVVPFVERYLNDVSTFGRLEAIEAEISKSLGSFANSNENEAAAYYNSMYCYMIDFYSSSTSQKQKLFEQTSKQMADCLNNMAWYHYEKAKKNISLKEAIEWSQKSLSIMPENAFYMDTYAHLLFKIGKKSAAIQWQTKAVQEMKNGKVWLYEKAEKKKAQTELNRMKAGTSK